MAELHVHDLARLGYDAALALQQQFLSQVLAAGPTAPGHLLLLEHDPPVITLGRRGKEHDILLPPAAIEEKGIEIRAATRGGEVTYHGPGQLVLYLLHRLRPPAFGVRDHVRGLEEAVLRTVAEFGVSATRGESRSGTTGVWTTVPVPSSSSAETPSARLGEKLAAVGVAVHRWVTYHGLALNVCTDLSRFDLIVPCGLRGKGVTSLSKILGRTVEVEEVKPLLVRHVAEVFDYSAVVSSPV